ALFNLGSLVLGLISWTLPIVNLTRYKNNDYKNWRTFSVLSMSTCAISLYFQILYNYHLVKIGDWSALMYTTGAVVFVAAVLLISTIILNAITMFVYRKRTM